MEPRSGGRQGRPRRRPVGTSSDTAARVHCVARRATRARRYHGFRGRQAVIRFAVVGLGRMGRFYAQTLARLGPKVELYAVADPDPRARAAVQAELGLS